MKFDNQRDLGCQREMPMRNSFSLNPKNKKASKLLTLQNIHQKRVSKTQVTAHSHNNERQEKVTTCFVNTKVMLDVSLILKEEQLNELRMKPENSFRIKSSVTNQEKVW